MPNPYSQSYALHQLLASQHESDSMQRVHQLQTTGSIHLGSCETRQATATGMPYNYQPVVLTQFPSQVCYCRMTLVEAVNITGTSQSLNELPDLPCRYIPERNPVRSP